jgi:3-oxoacyl-[acyl-carrier-protein] synthase III
VTGLAVPSLDARIASVIGLRPDVKRMPLVGLGCVAGAAGIARLHDYLVGHPDDVAVLVAVELCSLTVQRDDVSVPNLVASGLFADGAAAVVAAGRDRDAGLVEMVATRSRLYPDSERTMGFDVTAGGLRIVLDAQVPRVVERYLGDDVDEFLADQGLTRADVEWWVCHPGGPKVIEALQQTLGLSHEAVRMTWESLARVGNLSSASVLHVFADTLRDRPPRPGSLGMVIAMGPRLLLRAGAGPCHRGACPMTSLVAFTVLIGLVGLERLAELVVSKPQRRVEPRARRARDRARALPGDGGAAHGTAGRRAGRGMGTTPRRAARARLVDAGAGARVAGTALVVHRHARPSLEHAGDRRARPGAGAVRPLPPVLPPQLRGGRRRGRGPADGPRGLADRARVHARQRGAADRADPGGERGTPHAAGVRRGTVRA